MSFIFLSVFKSNEHKDYYNRGSDDENLLFEIEDSTYIYVVENIVSFETTDNRVEKSSNDAFNDVEYHMLTV